jgi:aminoglycoside phosphotransferase (APT) family kinase protein
MQSTNSNQSGNSIGAPVAELTIDLNLVRRLLGSQHPDLAHLPLQHVDAGWDNTMFRLGDRLAVRLPRRASAATLIEHEQTWLPLIADRLPIAVPKPERIGLPSAIYPWRWSVLPWLSGVTADRMAPHPEMAEPFAAFLRSLHVPAPANAPHNPVRGVPLIQRAATVTERMHHRKSIIDSISPEIWAIWDRAVKTSIDLPPTWLHGDLHARNVLVDKGRISGIIDWGDITSGDVATDLAAIWMLFSDRSSRQQAIAAYNTTAATLDRAQGWAILFGVVLLDTGLVDNPQHAVMGENTLRRVVEDGWLMTGD